MRQWWPMPETIGPQRVLGSDWDRRILDYGVEIADILRSRIEREKRGSYSLYDYQNMIHLVTGSKTQGMIVIIF